MEVDFEHEHILTFCEKSKKKFLQILSKEEDQQEESREVEGDDDKLKNPEEVAELDDEDYPMCCVCSEVVHDGPAYFCETCDDFWLHESCASLPRELRDHHLHSHHDNPLILRIRKRDVFSDSESSSSSSNNIVPICDGCRDIIIVPTYYHCTECGLKLDCRCALSPYNDGVQQITSSLPPETKTEISHVCHPHKLHLFNLRKEWCPEIGDCSLCKTQLLGLTYGCFDCDFFLHKGCLELMTEELVTEISHVCHPHKLLHFNLRKELCSEIGDCSLCETQLLGLTYGCFDCDFFLHKGCLELMTEELVQHPCHSHHPLVVEHVRGKFICDKCREVCSGFKASCKECDVKIDFNCAFLVDTRNGVIQRSTLDGVKTKIRHFGDEFHLLSLFNCKEAMELVCNGCRMPLSGPTYGCLECSFYLHKSCAELPKEIRHPYHPHKLYLKFSRRKPCEACGIRPWGKYFRLAYQCYQCYHFLLDSLCAINSLGVISALRNKDYHPQDLYYFVAPDHLVGSRFPCKICGQNCHGSFFNCLGFGFNTYFHIDCIGIPREIKHDCHMHMLTLMYPIMEKETDESLSKMYYCFFCEKPRNPKYHFYDCQQCASTGHIFTAHIECVLSNELVEIEPDRMIKGDGEDGHRNYPTLSTLSLNPKCIRQLVIGEARNDHVLSYSEQGFFDFSCDLCDETLEDRPGYACSDCGSKLHKECAELPFHIKHILHEHQPLTIAESKSDKRFICDGCCVYHKYGISYECEECDFVLDLKCASPMISSNGDRYQKPNDNGRKLTISHFTHNHTLRFASIAEELQILCQVCSLRILGPTYCCFRCYFFLHESCCDEPQFRPHPFHIHPLELNTSEANDNCKACDSKIGTRVSYGCYKCEFRLHTKCVKYLTSSLQHKCHKHNLFFFVAEDIIRDESDEKQFFQCKECGKDCSESFYRCVKCNLSLHIECIPIPQKVKSECHVHTLVLVDSITEDGYKEYYCHACEELRNPKHAVYACRKCHYTAHIGCVLNEEDGTLEIL